MIQTCLTLWTRLLLQQGGLLRAAVTCPISGAGASASWHARRGLGAVAQRTTSWAADGAAPGGGDPKVDPKEGTPGAAAVPAGEGDGPGARKSGPAAQRREAARPVRQAEAERLVALLQAQRVPPSLVVKVVQAYEHRAFDKVSAEQVAQRMADLTAQRGCLGRGLDLMHLVATDARLVAMEEGQLAASVTRLLAELDPVVGPDTASSIVRNSLRLRTQLARSCLMADRISLFTRAYTRLVGAPPPATLFTRRSSHVNIPSLHVVPKLAALVDAFGPSAVHAMMHKAAHLLSSTSNRLGRNGAWLQARLGLSDERLRKMVAMAPRILNTHSKALEATLRSLQSNLGCSHEELVQLCWQTPALLTSTTATTMGKLTGLKDLLGHPPPAQLIRFLRSQPSVLMCNTDSLVAKLQSLAELLGVSKERALRLCLRSPSVLTISPQHVARQLEGLAQVLHLTPDAMRAVALSSPAILNYKPATMAARASELHALLGLSREEVGALARRTPYSIFQSPRMLAARVRMFKALVAQSPEWTKRCEVTAEITIVANVAATGKRILLRMEYLLGAGLDSQVTTRACVVTSSAAWDAAHPGYAAWVQQRLAQLAADPSEWGEALNQAPGRVTYSVGGPGSSGSSSTTTRDDAAATPSSAAQAAPAQAATQQLQQLHPQQQELQPQQPQHQHQQQSGEGGDAGKSLQVPVSAVQAGPVPREGWYEGRGPGAGLPQALQRLAAAALGLPAGSDGGLQHAPKRATAGL